MKERVSYKRLELMLIVGLLSVPAVSLRASGELFQSGDPAKTPLSVPLDRIEDRINSDESADGIVLYIVTRDDVMRVDIKEMPGKTSMAAVLRVIMMIGRLAEPKYKEMRIVDEGADIFAIDGVKIRDIGSQFVWGEEGKGQNPIHLIRLFVDALRTPDGQRVAPEMTGSLFGDTSIAMKTINERFHPDWTMKTLKMR